jgi:hypothetical protein
MKPPNLERFFIQQMRNPMAECADSSRGVIPRSVTCLQHLLLLYPPVLSRNLWHTHPPNVHLVLILISWFPCPTEPAHALRCCVCHMMFSDRTIGHAVQWPFLSI